MAWLQLVIVMLASLTVAGCELAGDIFQAGVWVGVVFVVLLIAVVGFIAAKLRG